MYRRRKLQQGLRKNRISTPYSLMKIGCTEFFLCIYSYHPYLLQNIKKKYRKKVLEIYMIRTEKNGGVTLYEYRGITKQQT